MNKIFLFDCTITKDCNPVCSVHTDTEIQNIKFDDDLIQLVGTLPYTPVEKDKDIIREAVERLIK